MRILHSSLILLTSVISATLAASSWSFEDATLTVQAKGSGVGSGIKESLSPSSPIKSKTIAFANTDSLKISLTATEGKSGKKPHQAFLTFTEPSSGLEESFGFNVKDNGKAKIEVTQKDLPYQLLTSSQPLRASIVIASFGSSTPLSQHAFDVDIRTDSTSAPVAPAAPERYISKPEIHHIFRAGPKSGPKILSLVFTLAVLTALPVLFGGWLYLGGNLDDFGKAFGASPVAHGLFLGSIVAMEGVFFMYYVSWNLFQTLPVAAVVGTVAVLSGSRALTEVQSRRLAGER